MHVTSDTETGSGMSGEPGDVWWVPSTASPSHLPEALFREVPKLIRSFK